MSRDVNWQSKADRSLKFLQALPARVRAVNFFAQDLNSLWNTNGFYYTIEGIYDNLDPSGVSYFYSSMPFANQFYNTF